MLIDANQKPQSTFIPLSRKNIEAKSDYIQANSQKVSDLMHRLRQTDARTSDLQKSISDGKYDYAEKELRTILSKNPNSTAKGLLTALDTIKEPKEKSDFFDLLLTKTSG